MKMPPARSRSTYSYAVAPFFGAGVLSAGGVIGFMCIVAFLDPIMENKLMPILTATLILYVTHAMTKDRVPGGFSQGMTLWLGKGLLNYNGKKSVITQYMHKMQIKMAEGYGLPASPTVIGKYEL
jgi:hypothetical protein